MKRLGKKLIVIGLLIAALFLVHLFLAPHLALAQNNFGLNETANGLNNSLPGGGTDLRTVIARIINFALGFLGLVFLGVILWGGFRWMTAAGDEEKITEAKKILRNGIIGLAIILASWAIATFIISRLGGAIGGGGNGSCVEGTTSSCGCGGYMSCSGGVWGGCIGSDCGGGPGPTSCNATLGGATCTPVNQICAPGNYCDPTSCLCKPQGGSGDSCDSDLTNATCDPDNNLCGQYLSCDPATCLCAGPPVITGVSPTGGFCQDNPNQSCTQDADCATTCNASAPNGTADNFLTISGKNFGAYSATTSQVIFEGAGAETAGVSPATINSACVDSWQDTQIVIAVPAGVATGPIKVINRDNLNDTTDNDYGPKVPDFTANNISRPGLCLLNPIKGVLSSPVAYQGANLYSGSAYFGNYQTNVRGLDSNFNNPNGLAGTALTPNIQAGDSGSFVINSVSGHQEKSNYLRFIKDREPGEGPYIISFAPTTGAAGQYVTIRGQGFGGARGTSRVFFGDQEAAYDFPEICLNSVWRDDQIIVKVPAGLADGYDVIKIVLATGETIDTQKLNPNTFQADKNASLKTSLCKINPTLGAAQTPVTLWGEYLGNVGSDALVKFNYDKNATGPVAKDGRADMIETTVPDETITGPVHVVKNGEWGNELNFRVGECQQDSDCSGQICCPSTTYKKGRCVDTLADCYINIPTSVFEWNFNTGFGPSLYSCAGAAGYYGSCQAGATCPNVPGTCSPYAGGVKTAVGACDTTCAAVPGCQSFAPDNCTYNSALDQCVKNGANATCDLAQEFTYTYNAGGHNVTATTTKTCNADGKWEITLAGRCPEGWQKNAGNRCVDGDCSLCASPLTCASVNDTGRCVSAKICPAGATCESDPASPGVDKCFITKQPSCDCCCQIGQDARDCCAPLKCEGTCGQDTGKTANVQFGRCGGCKLAGNTPEERDAACNCSGHSGQFCDINNPEFPNGVCSDCSGLNKQDCNDHSSVCCLDAQKTPDPADDACRGGSGQEITNNTSSPEFGYCGYYNCSVADPTQCASTTPVKLGEYNSTSTCITDCPNADPCAGITDMGACLAKSGRCCFDAKETTSAKCRLGDRIPTGGESGYCAYYNCQNASSTPPGDPTLCASSTPFKDALYPNISTCDYYCAHPPQGPGLSCAGVATSTCESQICNFPGFSCLLANGSLGLTQPDCGTCCCQPGAASDACTALNPNLKCLADKGSCTGASRGLCCGCSSDSECGSPATIGCGSDTCCQARPQITSTVPPHLATRVCRNAVVKVNFNQPLDIASLPNNALLLEEKEYGNGVCPAGTYLTASGNSLADILNHKKENLVSRLYDELSSSLQKLFARLSGRALADTPNPSKLYCSVPGMVSGEISGQTGSLGFAPKKILDAAANYYFIVKGDENLNSQSGVLNLGEIGFNGLGYFDPSSGAYVAGELISFNGHAYKNSQIFKFTTLPDSGPTSGICAVDHVNTNPSSYLFKSTVNDLDENDVNPDNSTFDTKADKDKVFSGNAYSADNQLLQPITGYYWDWNFQITDTGVAQIISVAGLPYNKAFVAAQAGVTDSATRLNAKVDMTRFLSGCDNSPSCACLGDNCSNNCCNVFSGGDQSEKASDLYVFVCNNPWPPVAANGQWAPWNDTSANCLPSSGNCNNYNYKFYYCRDSGAGNTLSDLPAIISNAVTRGQGSDLVCSSDRTPCTGLNTACGLDQNGDGSPDGVCIWNVLKESYFFREAILPPGQITSALDLETGGAAQINWSSSASQVGSYKIYYLKASGGSLLNQPAPLTNCSLANGLYNCSQAVSGLTNNIGYIFKVSVISVNQTESELSDQKTVTPTDQTPPAVPSGLAYTLTGTTTLKFTWTKNTDDTKFYRLYRGLNPGQYGESFDSASGASSLTFNTSQFKSGDNYFALSALDAYNNESAKSGEIIVTLP